MYVQLTQLSVYALRLPVFLSSSGAVGAVRLQLFFFFYRGDKYLCSTPTSGKFA
jgi:hypothetical protein